MLSKHQDISRLLRGQTLKDAQLWAQGKSLSDWDYQFLAASVELDRKEVQQALEAAKSQAIAAQLAQEQKTPNFREGYCAGSARDSPSFLGWGSAPFCCIREACKANDKRD